MANTKTERREDCSHCGWAFNSCSINRNVFYRPCCTNCKHEEKRPQVQRALREKFGQVHAGS